MNLFLNWFLKWTIQTNWFTKIKIYSHYFKRRWATDTLQKLLASLLLARYFWTQANTHMQMLSKKKLKVLVSRLVCRANFKVNVWLLNSLGGHALPSSSSSPVILLLMLLCYWNWWVYWDFHTLQKGGGGCWFCLFFLTLSLSSALSPCRSLEFTLASTTVLPCMTIYMLALTINYYWM